MTILPALRDHASVVRRVTVGDDRTVQVVDAVGAGIQCALSPPATVEGGDTSPRTYTHGRLWYAGGTRLPADGPLLPSDRVEATDGTVWEILRPSRPLRAGRRELGWETTVLPVDRLYPYAVEIWTQGGGELLVDNVPMAIYTPSKSQSDKGEYVDTVGESPIEYWSYLDNQNCQVRAGGRIYMVTELTVDYAAPRCQVRFRSVE